MNLFLAVEIAEARGGISEMMRPMFYKAFSGLAPGTTYLKDDEFMRWYESEIVGIPGTGEVDPATGIAQMWRKPPRPNFEQMLALAGEDGKEILYRYSKLTGRHEQMKVFVQVVNFMAAEARKQQRKAA